MLQDWLGRQDSNLGMAESKYALTERDTEISKN
jgi:hypothetical protein